LSSIAITDADKIIKKGRTFSGGLCFGSEEEVKRRRMRPNQLRLRFSFSIYLVAVPSETTLISE
jgi:hypothetical protein